MVENFGYSGNNNCSHQFMRLLQRRGIGDTLEGKASFHSLRGIAITCLKEHGIRGEELRSITGHESSSVEDVYARDIRTISGIAKGFVVFRE